MNVYKVTSKSTLRRVFQKKLKYQILEANPLKTKIGLSAIECRMNDEKRKIFITCVGPKNFQI